MSRDEIVDEINRLGAIAGITCGGRSQKVTLAVLDKWVAPGAKAHQIPLRMLPLFCRAVDSNYPLEVYSAYFKSARVISEERHKVLGWAEKHIENRKSKKVESLLAKEVGL